VPLAPFIYETRRADYINLIMRGERVLERYSFELPYT